MRKAGLLWAFPLLAGTLLLSAQQPVFRSGVQYVAVDAVVTDRSDNPVTDLRKDEVEILENGRPQKIADFRFVSIPVAHRAVDASAAAEPEPDVATNVASSTDSRLFVVVIDDLHLIESEIVPIKRVLTDFVKAVSPDDDVAMVFVGRSDLGTNFTRNTGRLLATINRVREALGFGLDAMGASAGPGVSVDAAKIRQTYGRSAAFVLKNVASSLAGSGHARRAIVYVSGGTTLQPFAPASPNYDPVLHDDLIDAFETAHRADVPVYTVDPRGLVLAEDAVRGGIGAIHSAGMRSQIAANIRAQHDYLSEVALNTGGRAFVGNSDLTRAVNEIVAENGSYYLLGYYPDPQGTDGKFHEIKVHVTRPDMRVRARQGYLAPSTQRASTAVDGVLSTAMKSGVNVSGLPLRVFVAPVAVAAKGVTSVVTMEVAYPLPVNGERRIDDTLELSLLALDADGKVKASVTKAMSVAATAPSSDAMNLTAAASPPSAIFFLIDDAIDLPAQPLTLRVGVASQALGVAGTSQVPITVPKISDGKLQMGGVAVGLAGPPREAAINQPLIAPLVPFQPTLARVFTSGDTLRLFGRVFWKGKDQPVVSLTLSGAGAPATSAAPVVVKDAGSGRQEAVFDANFPLANVAPGHYRLAIDARLPNGQDAVRTILLDVK